MLEKNVNIKSTIILILPIFILLSACTSDVDGDIFEIAIKEKNNESISIEVKNIGKELTFYGILVERQTADGWLPIKNSLFCPCQSICAAVAPPMLDEGESTIVKWDYLDNSCSEALPGIYRFAAYGKVFLGASNIFTIK